MKQQLRQLTIGSLSHLAYLLGVVKEEMTCTKEELVQLVATYCADYNLIWSDLISRFTFLQKPEAHEEIMTGASGQTGTPRANSRTKRLAPLRDTKPVSDLDGPMKGLSSSSRAVGGSSPHARAAIAVQVELVYYKSQLTGESNQEEKTFLEGVIKELEHSLEVLRRESIKEMKKLVPR